MSYRTDLLCPTPTRVAYTARIIIRLATRLVVSYLSLFGIACNG